MAGKRYIHIGYLLTTREARELRAAAKLRGLALATISRNVTARFFGIKLDSRELRGPRAASTRKRRRAA